MELKKKKKSSVYIGTIKILVGSTEGVIELLLQIDLNFSWIFPIVKYTMMAVLPSLLNIEDSPLTYYKLLNEC